MKFFGLAAFVFFIISSHLCWSKTLKQEDFEEELASNYAKLLGNLNCASLPLNKSCPSCEKPADGSKLYFYHQIKRLLKHTYKFMIHVDDDLSKVVISFSGPTATKQNYLRHIYSTGFRNIKQYGIKVESEFSRVYYRLLRQVLTKKVQEILKEGKETYSFHFIGHSIGGSISLLAAFDLIKQNILYKEKNHPTVFTYGNLRIGDINLVNKVNESITVYRIVKNNDFLVRVPNCYFSNSEGSWKCVDANSAKTVVKNAKSLLSQYMSVYANDEQGDDKYKNYLMYLLNPQPYGKLILYNKEMTKRLECSSKVGVIPACEKKINLPSVFSPQPHFRYFGVDFSKCSN